MLTALAAHVRQVREPDWARLAIADLWLDNLFVSVRLNDGAVGLALNYDQEGLPGVPRDVTAATRAYLLETLSQQPLLWELLTRPADSLAQVALLIALLSALSAPVLASQERLAALGLQALDRRIPLRAFPTRRVVTIVGAGGFLDEAVAEPSIEQVCCCDLNFADEEFRGKVERRFPQAGKRLVLDDGGRTLELIGAADVVCITASTLCNGSLESLLPSPAHSQVIILEGPSGGVLPGPLFDRGVTHLVHNPVDVDYVHLSQRFSRQQEKGLTTIVSGRFIDILLPEQRTVRGARGSGLES
jgi:hypothetical protein